MKKYIRIPDLWEDIVTILDDTELRSAMIAGIIESKNMKIRFAGGGFQLLGIKLPPYHGFNLNSQRYVFQLHFLFPDNNGNSYLTLEVCTKTESLVAESWWKDRLQAG